MKNNNKNKNKKEEEAWSKNRESYNSHSRYTNFCKKINSKKKKKKV